MGGYVLNVVHQVLRDGYGVHVAIGDADADYAAVEYERTAGRRKIHAFRSYEIGVAAVPADWLKALCRELELADRFGEICDRVRARGGWTGRDR
jgi:hypothetical protein